MANKVMTKKDLQKRIGALRGMVNNVSTFIQETAVGIVRHAFGTEDGQGSGDVSLASDLLRALPNTFDRTYLIRWFRQCGIMINPGDNYAAKVVKSDAKDYRPAADRIAFADANNWFEAVDDAGNRAPWYQGPTPKEREPNTFEDFADNVIGFADRTAKNIREGKLSKGSDKPAFVLTNDEQEQAMRVLGLVRKLGMAISDTARRHKLQEELENIEREVTEAQNILNDAPNYNDVAPADKTGTQG